MVFVFPSLLKKEIHPQGMQSGIDSVLLTLQRIDRQFDLSFAAVFCSQFCSVHCTIAQTMCYCI